jgi:DnaJ like chaperone protein
MFSAIFIGNVLGMIFGYLVFKHWLGGMLGFFAGGWLVRQIQLGLNTSPGTGGFAFGGNARQRQQVFFESFFLAMGHLAKADGRVSEEEIQAARSTMHRWRLRPEDVRVAIELFSRGKSAEFPLESQMARLAAACQGQPQLIRAFLENLLEMPLSSGGIHATERDVLWRIAASLGVSRVEMAQLEALARARRNFGQQPHAAMSGAAELEQAYKALGIEPEVTDKEVKTAYRRLMNQHHPDKLVSKGLPESMMEAAKERTREIRGAYELVRKTRGFK